MLLPRVRPTSSIAILCDESAVLLILINGPAVEELTLGLISVYLGEASMKSSRLFASATLNAFVLTAPLAILGLSVSAGPAAAVVYCQYIGYPPSCVARPGVVLAPRPVARAVAREAVRPGTPMNRGGPVNRVGRR